MPEAMQIHSLKHCNSALKQGNLNGGLLGLMLAILVSGAIARTAEREESPSKGHVPFRLAMSASLFGEVNRNDARASMIVWSRAIAAQRDIPVDPEPRIFDQPEDMFAAVERGEVDAATTLVSEFAAQELFPTPATVYLSQRNGSTTVQYVLLVRRDSSIEALGDLQKRRLLLHQNPENSLAPAWIELLLAAQGLGDVSEVFTTVTQTEKASQAVLKVFFSQADVCVVTRDLYETLGELNPQILTQLLVLAESPELVPTFFFFREGYDSDIKAEIGDALLELHRTPQGQQVLTIFQGDRMERQPASSLQSAYELLVEVKRLRATRRAAGQTTVVHAAATPATDP